VILSTEMRKGRWTIRRKPFYSI